MKRPCADQQEQHPCHVSCDKAHKDHRRSIFASWIQVWSSSPTSDTFDHHTLHAVFATISCDPVSSTVSSSFLSLVGSTLPMLDGRTFSQHPHHVVFLQHRGRSRSASLDTGTCRRGNSNDTFLSRWTSRHECTIVLEVLLSGMDVHSACIGFGMKSRTWSCCSLTKVVGKHWSKTWFQNQSVPCRCTKTGSGFVSSVPSFTRDSKSASVFFRHQPCPQMMMMVTDSWPTST